MKQILTMGSLFDGSGGFPLAGAVNGIVPIWASEIEPYPIAVTRSRFPHMRHLGNVIEIDGGKIPPVDVITFGSPCQDMSVAGKRAGMKHTKKGAEEITRSGLFYEAIRIIREMRKVTNGKYPTFAVWENVPGAFSSNKGEDFRCVLQEITEVIREDVTVPRPDGGKWNHAGEIVGDGFNFAWRVLDAQYWGVPQRRKRIYLVADFGGRRAAEILFKQDSVRGNFASSGAEREGDSRNASGSADGSMQKLTAAAFCAGAAPSAGSIGYREEQSPTLKSANAGLSMHAVVYPNVARSLCARSDSSPCVDRGQNVVCVDCRNHREQSLREMRRKAEREQKAEKQRQAAAVLLAAQEVYGFGHKRAWRLLKRADEIVCTALSSEEVIREVWERMGLEINFREGVERIREVEEA